MHTPNGYTLIGFKGNSNRNGTLNRETPIFPIFFPNNPEIPVPSTLLNDIYDCHIILPELYTLKHVRGLDLIQILHQGCHFYYGNELCIFDGKHIEFNDYTEGWISKDMWRTVVSKYLNTPVSACKTVKDILLEVQLQYPKLFKPLNI